MTISAERLHELLAYDAVTGRFTRISTTCKRLKAGCDAGSINGTGYVGIQVDGTIYPAHRLAWLYVHGEMPDGMVDHINGDRGDNRLLNLRPATNAQNKANSKLRADNVSGLKGAYRDSRTGRWRAQIRCNGRLISLGRHDTAEQAHAAYFDAAKKLFGEFARAA